MADPGEPERMPLPWATGGALRLPCSRCGHDLRAVSIKGNCPQCGLPVSATVRIDPTESEPARSCRRCGYSMRGLGQAERCPECGHRVRGGKVRDEPLAHMPMPFIRSLARRLTVGAVLLALAVLGGAWLSFAIRGSGGGVAALLLQAMALVGASWVLTGPVDAPEALVHHLDERSLTRQAARWLAFAWLALVALGIATSVPAVDQAIQSSRIVELAFELALLVTAMAALLGAAVLGWHLGGFASWMRDDRAEWFLRTGAVLLVGAAAAMALSLAATIVAAFGVLACGASLGMVLGCLGLVIGAGLLARSAHLSVRHADERLERQRRQAIREEREQREAAERVRGTRAPGGS